MDLYYREYGHGSPLIVLHGLLGASGNWHGLASRHFAPHFHVFVVDQRNHGRSPHSDRLDYPVLADDLRGFMDAKALDSAHVLGHSMGGKAAMWFAAKYPDRVDRLVVADIAPRAYPPDLARLLDELPEVDLSRLHSRTDADRALAPLLPDDRERRFILNNLARRNGALVWRPNLTALRENYPGLVDELPPDARFDGPVLFIRGARSAYLRDDDIPLVRHHFPAARLATIPEAGHWVHADEPDAFAGEVLQFLGAPVAT
jgi:esterase